MISLHFPLPSQTICWTRGGRVVISITLLPIIPGSPFPSTSLFSALYNNLKIIQNTTNSEEKPPSMLNSGVFVNVDMLMAVDTKLEVVHLTVCP